MLIVFNSSGMPKGTGSLQIRGRVYWMIYADATGRKIQENTGTSDLAEARRTLARAALAVEREVVAALERIAHEAPTAAGSRRNDPAAGDSRSRANRKKPAKAAGIGGTHPRQSGARSPRKGEAA